MATTNRLSFMIDLHWLLVLSALVFSLSSPKLPCQMANDP